MSRLIKPKKNYTTVENTILNDDNVSWKAKGMYAYLLSKPDDYDFSGERVAKHSKDGERSTYSAIQELEDTGYLYREKLPTGKVDYHLFNSPEEYKEFVEQNKIEPVLRFSKQAFQQTAETQDISNTEFRTSSSSKKEYREDFENFELDEVRTSMWFMKGYTEAGIKRQTLNWRDYVRSLPNAPSSLSSSLDTYLSNRLAQELAEQKTLENSKIADEKAKERIGQYHERKRENIAKINSTIQNQNPKKPVLIGIESLQNTQEKFKNAKIVL